jgi:hypothetical protein
MDLSLWTFSRFGLSKQQPSAAAAHRATTGEGAAFAGRGRTDFSQPLTTLEAGFDRYLTRKCCNFFDSA